jgi:hypothetical protein
MNMPKLNARTEIRHAEEGEHLSPKRGQRDPKAAIRFSRDSIKFLIGLSETDPAALVASGQPGDLINLVFNFYRFHYLGGAAMARDEAVAEARGLADALRANPERLELVVESLKLLLTNTADGGRFELPLLPGTKAVSYFTSDARRTHFLWSPRDDRYEGLRQAIVYGALQLLHTQEGAMVRRCARQTCHRIFLAARPKQIFCSRRCASAAVFERYKQKLGEDAYRAKHRETARHSEKVRKQKERIRQRRQH